MTLSQLSDILGIETYPTALEPIYETVKAGAKPLFSRELVDRLQEEYNLFGEYYEDVLKGLADLEQKPNELAWATVAGLYVQSATRTEAAKVPFPAADGSPARDMLPVFLLIPLVDRAVEEYQRRGFSREEAIGFMKVFRGDIGINVRRHGRPGLDRTYYDWITLYVFAIIFPCGGFLFNIGRNRKDNYVLRNKKDGKVVVLLDDRSVHRSGYILGTAGMTDEEGAFHTSVTETETEWIGNAVGDDCLLQREARHFSKAEWTLEVAPGDCALSIHIPRNGDLAPEKAHAAIEAAFCHARTYYKEYDVKAIQCGSWLLNPGLGEIVGPHAKISVFGGLFQRYPIPSNGKSVFNFVFQASVNPDIKSLPENTSLQKALKEKYLAGGYHYDFGGYILPEA